MKISTFVLLLGAALFVLAGVAILTIAYMQEFPNYVPGAVCLIIGLIFPALLMNTNIMDTLIVSVFPVVMILVLLGVATVLVITSHTPDVIWLNHISLAFLAMIVAGMLGYGLYCQR